MPPITKKMRDHISVIEDKKKKSKSTDNKKLVGSK